MPVVVAHARRGHPRCPWCRDACTPDGPWGRCPRDRTPVHHACAREFGRCPGCGVALEPVPRAPGTARLRVRVTPRAPRAAQEPPGPAPSLPWPVVVGGAGAAALALGAGPTGALVLGLAALVARRAWSA